MKGKALFLPSMIALLTAGACTTIPMGPSITSLPGSGRTFNEFRVDDTNCKQYASSQIDSSPNQAANNSGVTSAAVGTVIGAVAGAAINGGRGAGVGAGAGLLIGSAAGAGAAERTGYTYQQRYDTSYQQCMYAKGHKVPVSGRVVSQQPAVGYVSPPPPPPPRSATYAPAPSYGASPSSSYPMPPPSSSYPMPPPPGSYSMPPPPR